MAEFFGPATPAKTYPLDSGTDYVLTIRCPAGWSGASVSAFFLAGSTQVPIPEIPSPITFNKTVQFTAGADSIILIPSGVVNNVEFDITRVPFQLAGGGGGSGSQPGAAWEVKTGSFAAEVGKQYLCVAQQSTGISPPASATVNDWFVVLSLYNDGPIFNGMMPPSGLATAFRFDGQNWVQAPETRIIGTLSANQIVATDNFFAGNASFGVEALPDGSHTVHFYSDSIVIGEATRYSFQTALGLHGSLTLAGPKIFSGPVAFTSSTRPTCAPSADPIPSEDSLVAFRDVTRNFRQHNYSIAFTPGIGIGQWLCTHTGTGSGAGPVSGSNISTIYNGFFVTTLSGGDAKGRLTTAAFLAGALLKPGTTPWNLGINYSSPLVWSFRLSVGTGVDAATKGWFKIGGKKSHEATYDLTADTGKSVGVRQLNGNFYPYVHNGTTLFVGSTPLKAVITGDVLAIEIVGDGAGNYGFFVNRVLAATLNSGPTGYGYDDTLTGIYVDNNGPTGNRQIAVDALTLSYI